MIRKDALLLTERSTQTKPLVHKAASPSPSQASGKPRASGGNGGDPCGRNDPSKAKSFFSLLPFTEDIPLGIQQIFWKEDKHWPLVCLSCVCLYTSGMLLSTPMHFLLYLLFHDPSSPPQSFKRPTPYIHHHRSAKTFFTERGADLWQDDVMCSCFTPPPWRVSKMYLHLIGSLISTSKHPAYRRPHLVPVTRSTIWVMTPVVNWPGTGDDGFLSLFLFPFSFQWG